MTHARTTILALCRSALAIMLVALAAASAVAVDESLPSKFARLVPLHTRKGPPEPGDWLASHPEPGQTYRQYLAAKPNRVTKDRDVLYVQPLSKFTPVERKVIDRTSEYLDIYFGVEVKVLDTIEPVAPETAKRKHPRWGMDQLLTTWLLGDVLQPRLPRDATALLGFTSSDLWPGEGWNFVFGMAMLRERVGVWSIYRMGEPEKGEEEFRLCLKRTMKLATHETGHMFSMSHCTLYECNMCGCNGEAEADRNPLDLCPHCLAKLAYATGADPEKRFERLLKFYEKNGFDDDAAFCRKSLDKLRDAPHKR